MSTAAHPAASRRLLQRLRRAVRLAMLRSQYRQQALQAAQIEAAMQQDSQDQMVLRRSLRVLAQEIQSLGEIPPHLPDHIHQGQPRCEP